MRDITLGDTFTFCFTTRSFSTGVPTSLLGTPVLSVKEGANDTVITAGVSVDVDTGATPVTGLNEGTVVATSGNGYEAGKSYAVYISTGTVGGVSVVGEVVEQFTIQLSAAAVDLANGTDGLGAIKADSAAILVDTGTTLDARIPAALTANGNMKSSILEFITTALTETSGGLITAAFKKFFDKATPTGTINSIPDAVAGAAGGLFIAGSNAATTANITGNITGDLSGSVGSVTGAVGSVTGAVGSVTGAVGSVTGAVGSIAAGGITAASIATDAIDDDALATDAVTAIVNAVFTTAMTESYAADGATATLAQAMYMLLGREYEFAISGDTLTVKKLDGSTTAATFTLAPAGGPYTSITRTT